jgi:uncharacterized RDD family membrane protein YckC
MPTRNQTYVASIIILAIVFTTPFLFAVTMIGFNVYFGRARLTLSLSDFCRTLPPHLFEFTPLWRGQFVTIEGSWDWANDRIQYRAALVPAAGGESTPFPLKFGGRESIYGRVFGDRLFFQGHHQAYEYSNGEWIDAPSEIAARFANDGQYFLWNGNPSIISKSSDGFHVLSLANDSWGSVGILNLPDPDRLINLSGFPIYFRHANDAYVFNSATGTHLFLNVGGRLLYRKGLDFKQTANSQAATESDIAVTAADNTASGHPSLAVGNSDEGFSEFSLVRAELPTRHARNYASLFGLLIDGEPAALIIDEATTGTPIGHLYRFDGSAWTEVFSHVFPFGSQSFRVLTTDDGVRSYVAVTTPTRNGYLYAIENSQLRETHSSGTKRHLFESILLGFVIGPAILIASGALYGGIVTLLMRWCRNSEYGFGNETVKLASLALRGLARAIDFCFVGLLTVFTGWLVSRKLDWLTAIDAVCLNVNHPAVDAAKLVIGMTILSTVISTLILVWTQARWGTTPGKWICRLKTLRTDLRECGFARSLAREAVFVIDCLYVLCWTPGIVSIALSEKRQRLGDFVADTIVIEANSIQSRKRKS